MKAKLNLKLFKHILVYSLNYIGDTLFTTPVFPALKEYNPDIFISAVVGNRGGYQILKDNPYIDNLINVNGGITRKYTKIRNELDGTIPAIAVILENSFESALICFLLGIRYRIGIPHQSRGILLTHRTKSKSIHSVDRFLSNLSFFSGEVKTGLPTYYINQNEIDKSKFDFTENVNIGLVPSTTNDKKKYSIENYIKLIDYALNNIDNCIIYLIGSEDAKSPSKEIKKRMSSKRLIDLAGKTENLTELGYVIKHMNVVIGADTGPLHLSNALSVPTIFLYNTPKFERTAPYNRKLSFIHYPQKDNGKAFLTKNINSIDPTNIYESLLKILNC
jgi:ADP-heptose:LPS heptosyltransferase